MLALSIAAGPRSINYTTVRLCYAGGLVKTVSVTHPLPEPLIELVAQRFRVLGEPMRIKLLGPPARRRCHRRRAPGSARRLPAQNVSKAPRDPARRGNGQPRPRTATTPATRSATPACSSSATKSAAECAASSKTSRQSSRQADPAARCHERAGQPVRATFNPDSVALRRRRPRAHVAQLRRLPHPVVDVRRGACLRATARSTYQGDPIARRATSTCQ